MTNFVQIQMSLECKAERQPDRWVSFCPALQVYSQGPTLKEAKSNLEEAIRLWIESCLRRGTLHDALLEVGFKPAPKGQARQSVNAPQPSPATRVFPIHVNTPAYAGSRATA